MSMDIRTLAMEARKLGYATAEECINRLERMIARTEAHLTYRAGRNRHTPYDDTTAEDMVVVALVIELLRGEG
jgi:hypothetical protein